MSEIVATDSESTAKSESLLTGVASALINVVGFTSGVLVVSTAFLRPSVRRRRSSHVYGRAEHDGSPLWLDFYHPDDYDPGGGGEPPYPPRPVLFWIHGGGWELGSRRFVPPGVLDQLDRGYVIVSASYSFLREAKWPAQAEEIDTAIGWVIDNATWLGVDAGRLVVAGESAGGHLAAMAGLVGRDRSLIRGVLAFYPPTDLTTLVEPGLLGRLAMSYFTGFRGSDALGSARAASPITHVSAAAPPFHVLHGTWDELVPVEQSVAFAQAMARAGADCELRVFENYVHIDPRFNRAEAMEPTEAFLDAVTAPVAPVPSSVGAGPPSVPGPWWRHPIRAGRRRWQERSRFRRNRGRTSP